MWWDMYWFIIVEIHLMYVAFSVENSYRPVTRGDLCLVQGHLLTEVGSPGGRPKKTISQLLYISQNSITTQIAVQKVD